LSEQHETLDRAGVVDDDTREVWLDLWAAATDEVEAVKAEEIEALRGN
jgi:hypothetical protein